MSGNAGRVMVASWAVGGVVALLASAVVRLGPVALEPLFDGNMLWWQTGLYAASVAFNTYAEGYRGIQRAFAPRVVARAIHLAQRPRPVHVLLGPAFAMGLFHATARRKAMAWGMTGGIIVLVLLMELVPQPYRGIVDAGVVVGLIWGLCAIAVSFIRALGGAQMPVSADLPVPAP